MDKALIIAQTRKWIIDVVVGCHFCPFALEEVKKDRLHFEVIKVSKTVVLKALLAALKKMDADAAVETLFLLLPQDFARFADYLKLVQASNVLLTKEGYSGIYQIASFHPAYLFAHSNAKDAANYTNRSPYPMLQILREESVSRAIDRYPDTNKIPERNIAFARSKGLASMQSLLAACMKIGH